MSARKPANLLMQCKITLPPDSAAKSNPAPHPNNFSPAGRAIGGVIGNQAVPTWIFGVVVTAGWGLILHIGEGKIRPNGKNPAAHVLVAFSVQGNVHRSF